MILIEDFLQQIAPEIGVTQFTINEKGIQFQNNFIHLVTDEFEIEKYYQIKEQPSAVIANVGRIVKLKLRVDLIVDAQLIPKGGTLWLVFVEKIAELGPRTELLREFLWWFTVEFATQLSTQSYTEIGKRAIKERIQKSTKPIWYSELWQRLESILKEWQKLGINKKIEPEIIGLRAQRWTYNLRN